MMRLSCADYTWPALAHDAALDLIAALGFDAVDIGYLAGRSHLRPEQVGDRPDYWAGRLAERCANRRLAIADVFLQPAGLDVLAANHPDPVERAAGLALFDTSLVFAAELGSPGITVLPGVAFDGEDNETAMARAVDGLRQRVDRAARRDVRVSFEPHVGSIADTPEATLALLDRVPGLGLTLDYGHFAFAGFADSDVEPLLEHTRHIQCRGGAPGVLQAGMTENRIDFARMVEAAAARGYDGYLACEYVWQRWHDCDRVDNLSETAALATILRAAVAARR